MGNSGIRKLMFCDSPVETPYSSLYQLDALTIDLQDKPLAQYAGQYTVIVNVGSNAPNTQTQLDMLRKLNCNVLLFPTNQFKNEPNTYQHIKDAFKGFTVFQKVEVNGKYTHPIFKFLKRNTPELYDTELANANLIKQDYCKFLISPEGKVLKYYKPEEVITI